MISIVQSMWCCRYRTPGLLCTRSCIDRPLLIRRNHSSVGRPCSLALNLSYLARVHRSNVAISPSILPSVLHCHAPCCWTLQLQMVIVVVLYRMRLWIGVMMMMLLLIEVRMMMVTMVNVEHDVRV